jgi:hypothetical protein
MRVMQRSFAVRSWRFHFGLKTFLIFVAFAALFADWGRRYYVCWAAKNNFQMARAKYEAEKITTGELLTTSKEWLNAELRVPFFSSATAHAAQVDRIALIRKTHEMLFQVSIFVDGGVAAWKQIEDLKILYEQALDELRKVGGSEYANRVANSHAGDFPLTEPTHN